MKRKNHRDAEQTMFAGLRAGGKVNNEGAT